MPELPTSSLRRLPPAIQPIKTVFTYQSLWACHSVFESDAQRGGKEWPSRTPAELQVATPEWFVFYFAVKNCLKAIGFSSKQFRKCECDDWA